MNKGFSWYVVNVFAGSELRVAEEIKKAVELHGVQDKFGEILVPSVKIQENKRGALVEVEQMMYSGYIFVEMHMDDSAWYTITSISKVAGFLGDKSNPIAISVKEIEAIKEKIKLGLPTKAKTGNFNVGDAIEINEGSMLGFQGEVEEVHPDDESLTVSISVFGRKFKSSIKMSQCRKTE